MTEDGDGGEQGRLFVEPRWPIALAVGFYLALMIVLRIYEPDRPSFGTPWLVPGIMGGLLVALLLADPATSRGGLDGCVGLPECSSCRWQRSP